MRIHRNLHNARRGGPQWVSTAKGKVQAYLDEVYLVNVSTRIQPAGARKCADSGVRSVFAFFDGNQVDASDSSLSVAGGLWYRVAYDPRKDSTFLACDHAGAMPWNRADAVQLRADGVCLVLNPRLEN